MREYVSSLGKIIVYTAEEYNKTEYAKHHLGDAELKGYVVQVIPNPSIHKTIKFASYFFEKAKSENDALRLFKARAEKDIEKDKWLWLKRLLKSIELQLYEIELNTVAISD